MLTSEFKEIWLKLFSSVEKRLFSLVSELKGKGIIAPDKESDFMDLFVKYYGESDCPHDAECDKISDYLVRKHLLFADNIIKSQMKLKIAMERNLIRWIIDNYNKESIKDLIAMLLNDIKLEPKHFSDVEMCQSLYRLILFRFSKSRGATLESLLDTKAENLGLGAISVDEFVEFMFDDKRPVNEDFDSMIDYATKIVELNELISEEIKNND